VNGWRFLGAREVHRGERIPARYGVAFFDVARHAGVAFPVPLNLIIRSAYLTWLWVSTARPTTQEELWFAREDARLYRAKVAVLEARVKELENELEKAHNERGGP